MSIGIEVSNLDCSRPPKGPLGIGADATEEAAETVSEVQHHSNLDLLIYFRESI